MKEGEEKEKKDFFLKKSYNLNQLFSIPGPQLF